MTNHRSPDTVDDILSAVVNMLADPCDACDFDGDEAEALRQTIQQALNGLKELRAALDAGVAQKIPRQPTEAMLIAARDWSAGQYGKPIGNAAATGCWKAMLDASPVSSTLGEPAQSTGFPKCVTVERVVFRNFPGEFTDTPSAFVITADGKEWRLSEAEIVRALNAQPITPLSQDTEQ
jgi:hypothetical protein